MTKKTKPTDVLDKAPDGNIILNPVIRCRTFTAYGMSCGLHIETCHSDLHLQAILDKREQPDVIQIAMSPQQALILAQDLQKKAEQCLQDQSANTPQQ